MSRVFRSTKGKPRKYKHELAVVETHLFYLLFVLPLIEESGVLSQRYKRLVAQTCVRNNPRTELFTDYGFLKGRSQQAPRDGIEIQGGMIKS